MTQQTPHTSSRVAPGEAPPLVPDYPTRFVRCTECGHLCRVALRVISARCSNCTRPLQHLQDVVLTGRSRGIVSTPGGVHITRRGSVDGQVSCSQLTVEGRLNARVVVRGYARIAGEAYLTGSIHARSLAVAQGARLEAYVEIGPHPDTRGRSPTPPPTKAQRSTAV